MTRREDDQMRLGLYGQTQGLNSLLYQELEASQPTYYRNDSEPPVIQNGMELTMEDIQSILDMPQSSLVELTHHSAPAQPAERRERISSYSSSEVGHGSPESGISGCDSERATDQVMSPAYTEQKSPRTYRDPLQASLEQALIIPTTQQTLAPDNFLEAMDMTGLLQLAEESNQLMTSSNAEYESLVRSAMARNTNPLLGQTSPPVAPSFTSLMLPVPPVSMDQMYTSQLPARHTIRSHTTNQTPYARTSSTGTSVIVRAPNQSVIMPRQYSLPGSLSFSDSPDYIVDNSDKSSLPVTVAEFNTANNDSEMTVQPKKEPNPDGQYLCYVCGEKAGKHSYYGGQVCASCRAFFRRSVQSMYYEIFECKKEKNCVVNAQTRKNCQFCRFKKCLESGMKTSWVLSDEERNRRFNKFNKVNLKSASGERPQTIKKVSSARLPELYMAFTLEEQIVLQDIKTQFKGQYTNKNWLKNLLLLNRSAGVNLIESVYKVAPIKYETWNWLMQSWTIQFSANILPHFTKGHNIPSKEFSQLLNGTNLFVAHTFKSSMCIHITPQIKREVVADCGSKKEPCGIEETVKDLARNEEDVDNLDIRQMLSKLSLQESTPTMPTYADLYPTHWANNPAMEKRHLELVTKMQNWPINDKNEFDCNMILMMLLIIFFDTHANPLANAKSVEGIQLKYSMLLQRYLRSRMAVEVANKKFLEAMLLLSQSRELWEMNKLHAQI